MNPHLKRPLYVVLYAGVFFAFLPLLKEVSTISWFLVVIVLSFYFDFSGKRPLEDTAYKYIFTPILLIATIYTVFINFSILSLLNLLLMLESAKLLSPKRIRDIIQITVIGLFNLLMGAVFTIDLIFGVSILLFFISAALVFAIINVSDEIHDAPVSWRELRPFSVIIGTTPIFAMALAGLFFLLMPRTPISFFTGNFVDLSQNKGFPEDVQIGYVGELLQNTAVVFRAVPDSMIPENKLYWRTITYSYYDGSVWNNRLMEIAVSGRRFRFINSVIRGAPFVRVQYYLEPTASRMLYTLDHPVRFAMKSNQRFAFRVSSDYTIYFSGVGSSRIIYEVISQLAPIPAYRVDTTRYLQLPDRLHPEILKLAREFNSRYATDLKRARAVESYFRSNFRYNLKLYGAGQGEDPLEPFFKRREGYCEYFATAMALVLRSMGIPARTVGGFRGGEWNDYGKYYIIRENMAHMWVEAVIGDSIWMRFDPTPASESGMGGKRSFMSALMHRVSNYLDYIRIIWYGDVVNYTFERQKSMFSPVFRRLIRGPHIDWSQVILLFLIAAFVISIWRLFRYFARTMRVPAEVRIYRNVLRRYERIYRRKRPSETPLEFAKDVGDRKLEDFIRLYYRVRFYGNPDVRALKKAASELKTSDSRKPHRSSG